VNRNLSAGYILNDLIRRIERMSDAELRRRVRKADSQYRKTCRASVESGQPATNSAMRPCCDWDPKDTTICATFGDLCCDKPCLVARPQ